MSGLIACRAADTSIDSAGPVTAAALVAAWPVSITPTRDAVRPAAVTGRGFRHRRVRTTDASTRTVSFADSMLRGWVAAVKLPEAIGRATGGLARTPLAPARQCCC